MSEAFDTPIEDEGDRLVGPYRRPAQMLSAQEYDDHASIHDDATAQKLGFKGGTIEGPTHFSQIVPLGVALWGARFLSNGCISAQYRSAAYEGDRVRATAERPAPDAQATTVRIEREDGTEILSGTISIGAAPTALDDKLNSLKPLEKPVILRDVAAGARRPRVAALLGADTPMGKLYPFSLEDKLAVITEPSPWYEDADNPWGRPIIPIEMISVLANHVADADPWTVHGPTVDLFTDQEIKLLDGPLFVGEPYELEREVIALSGSKRTESVWIRTTIFLPGNDKPKAQMILSTASLKDSYEHYDRDLAALS